MLYLVPVPLTRHWVSASCYVGKAKTTLICGQVSGTGTRYRELDNDLGRVSWLWDSYLGVTACRFGAAAAPGNTTAPKNGELRRPAGQPGASIASSSTSHSLFPVPFPDPLRFPPMIGLSMHPSTRTPSPGIAARTLSVTSAARA